MVLMTQTSPRLLGLIAVLAGSLLVLLLSPPITQNAVYHAFAEAFDDRIFVATAHMLSGHTLKHLLASLTPVCLHLMLLRRQRLAPA